MDCLVIHRDSGIAIGKKEEDLYTQNYSTKVGAKRYELANHLGNVINIVSDRKIIDDKGANLYDTPSGKTNLSFNPEIIGYNDYYPFGMLVPNRHGQADSYRYGFNGKEKDDEVKGEGLQYDYGFRIYDSRLGKFLSTDPMFKGFPDLTPYQYSSNTPIWAIDLDGLEARISNTIESCAEISNNKAKLSLSADIEVTYKVLNLTDIKLKGTSKVYDTANSQLKRTLNRPANHTNSSLVDLQLNQTMEMIDYDINSDVNFSFKFKEIQKLNEIKPGDYVIILTDEQIPANEHGRNAPAHAELAGNFVTVSFYDDNYKPRLDDFGLDSKKRKSIASTIKHEILHNMGIDDEYKESTKGTWVPKGKENNSMADPSKNFITDEQMGEILWNLFIQNSTDERSKGLTKPDTLKKVLDEINSLGEDEPE
ncbi:RHS repeat domain-containing protein [Tenacibaculum maritimum]|uniref:RHS repeat domain-containing protein n=1 Tax=Tenacibaculum maritimum TaxID=107401 RepID=UPI0013302CF5|nr:RHS repeat-associated core domain-containing protein [Tenacibaculum maritimum]